MFLAKQKQAALASRVGLWLFPKKKSRSSRTD